MNVRRRTQGQQRAIDALVTSGALQGVPPDLAKAARFLEQLDELVRDLVLGAAAGRDRHPGALRCGQHGYWPRHVTDEGPLTDDVASREDRIAAGR